MTKEKAISAVMLAISILAMVLSPIWIVKLSWSWAMLAATCFLIGIAIFGNILIESSEGEE